MNARTSRTLLAAALLASAAAMTPSAMAAGSSERASIDAQFRLERDKCMSGRSHQDRRTCLKEAHAAYAEARAGKLGNEVDAATLRRNAMERCKRHSIESDRMACERMARGEGLQTGSVEGGGIYKELVVREVG